MVEQKSDKLFYIALVSWGQEKSAIEVVESLGEEKEKHPCHSDVDFLYLRGVFDWHRYLLNFQENDWE